MPQPQPKGRGAPLLFPLFVATALAAAAAEEVCSLSTRVLSAQEPLAPRVRIGGTLTKGLQRSEVCGAVARGDDRV